MSEGNELQVIENNAVTAYQRVSLPVVNEAQYTILYEPTPKHAIKSRPGRGGRTFRYVPHGFVTDRLNKAFGFNWDYRLLPVFNGDVYRLTEVEEKGKKTRNVAIYGELRVRVPDPFNRGEWVEIVKAGPGSQNWEETVEFGDALKGAKSDGLKVAAHELGIGLDLYYDDDEALASFEEREKQIAALRAEAEAATTPPAWLERARDLKAEGKGPAAIAKEVGATPGEVSKWIK